METDTPAFVTGEKGMICTFTGNWINPLYPEPEQIHIEDIAHALSNMCRFTGHTKKFYSVGQHSVLASYLVSKENRLYALLHDASEAYLADIARPIKYQPEFGTLYKSFEAKLMEAVCTRFGLPLEVPEDIKEADNNLLWAEIRDLMPNDVPEEFTKAEIEIIPWNPGDTERSFIARYTALTSPSLP